jgi:hypothetical protein
MTTAETRPPINASRCRTIGGRKKIMTEIADSVPGVWSPLLAEDVDAWLAENARRQLSVTVHGLLSILRRSIHRAQGRRLVCGNVALLCEPPRGTAGRLSKSLTLDQASAILAAAAWRRLAWGCGQSFGN